MLGVVVRGRLREGLCTGGDRARCNGGRRVCRRGLSPDAIWDDASMSEMAGSVARVVCDVCAFVELDSARGRLGIR